MSVLRRICTGPKIRKGDLVKLNPNDPAISRLLEWPLGKKDYMGSRPITHEEKEEWRENKRNAIKEAAEKSEDTFSIAFDDSGESRLPPTSVSIPLPIDRIYGLAGETLQAE